MTKKISTLIIFAFILFLQKIECTNTQQVIQLITPPKETILLKLPNNDVKYWKEITRNIETKKGDVEWIPYNQSQKNWSENIYIYFLDNSELSSAKKKSITNIEDNIENMILDAYANKSVMWKVLEKTESDILFEVINKDWPFEHVITRIFLTTNGVHRIEVSQKNYKMKPSKRDDWIKILKESTSVVSYKDAVNSKELSLVEKLKDSLDLGLTFRDWKIHSNFEFNSGHTQVCRIPPSQNETYITECLEITTQPLNIFTIDQVFSFGKSQAQQKSFEKIEFNIIKKNSTEIFYSYVHKYDGFQFNAVVRACITNQGFYVIVYKICLNEKMKEEDINYWKEQLEAIKIRN